MTDGKVTTTSDPVAGMFVNLTGATIPLGCEIAPLGDFVTNEKNNVASPVVLVMRTLIDDGPTTEIGEVSGGLSSKPLWPGNSDGENPEMVEATFDASAPAEPRPGSAEIALGIPPIGKFIAAVGVASCSC